MKRFPPAVARRIKSRRFQKQKANTAGILFGAGSLVSNLGLLGITVYAAFFSPFSQAVEAQLRSEMSEKSIEKVRLSGELTELQVEVRENATELKKQTQVLMSQQEELDRTQSDRAAAMKALRALREESVDLQSTLRDQYRQKYLTSLPVAWGDAPVPKIYVDAMNGILDGSAPSISRIGKEVYLTSVQALDRLSEGDAGDLERGVATKLREEIVRRCIDDNSFSIKFVAQVSDVDKVDATNRVNLISQAASLFREACLAR